MDTSNMPAKNLPPASDQPSQAVRLSSGPSSSELAYSVSGIGDPAKKHNDELQLLEKFVASHVPSIAVIGAGLHGQRFFGAYNIFCPSSNLDEQYAVTVARPGFTQDAYRLGPSIREPLSRYIVTSGFPDSMNEPSPKLIFDTPPGVPMYMRDRISTYVALIALVHTGKLGTEVALEGLEPKVEQIGKIAPCASEYGPTHKALYRSNSVIGAVVAVSHLLDMSKNKLNRGMAIQEFTAGAAGGMDAARSLPVEKTSWTGSLEPTFMSVLAGIREFNQPAYSAAIASIVASQTFMRLT